MDINKQIKTNQTSGYLQIQTTEGLDYQLEIAGLGARSHAFIIDWHIRLLLTLAWLAIVSLVYYFYWNEMLLTVSLDHGSLSTLILFVPAGLIYFLYHPVLELVMAGRTPGKRMTGLRLVNLQGHTPSIAAILLRNVFRLIDTLPGFYFLGLATIALTRNQVRIGDLAAGLVLVYDDKVDPKAMQQMTSLALHSRLSIDDQALLLDLLERWKELSAERKIHFAQLFLNRIGHAIPRPTKKNKLEDALKHVLESLLSES